ncbi:Uncharacterised protein [Mycobacteroides abscessus subsp. abscessus]|nr:Uncharacterised protein [Mycobacteroides abscessus subsp. abscessus]SKT58252.1 Uncharacterised protein [Mycobacteroides abscessus subsp. abscessus]
MVSASLRISSKRAPENSLVVVALCSRTQFRGSSPPMSSSQRYGSRERRADVI